MERKLWYSLGVSFVGGLLTTFIAVYCWGYIAAYSPVMRWLLDLGLRGVGLRLVLFPIDLLTNVAFHAPLAFVLLRLEPRKFGLYLLVAIIPSFLWLNLPLVGNEVFYELWVAFIPGWLHSLMTLPLAGWLVRKFARPGTPNNYMHATCEDARA